ncbi:hypothetical protein JRC42_24305 (plasmid) [Escherichia albertii]|nr:hypothetical protein [Escherichia albertii]QST30965.1 hypothetical protein JRC42_24305 [Escherichia albertii]QST40278.1 hypothetical protein JRC46_24155 [Escherichia albertii]
MSELAGYLSEGICYAMLNKIRGSATDVIGCDWSRVRYKRRINTPA